MITLIVRRCKGPGNRKPCLPHKLSKTIHAATAPSVDPAGAGNPAARLHRVAFVLEAGGSCDTSAVDGLQAVLMARCYSGACSTYDAVGEREAPQVGAGAGGGFKSPRSILPLNLGRRKVCFVTIRGVTAVRPAHSVGTDAGLRLLWCVVGGPETLHQFVKRTQPKLFARNLI